MRNYRSLLLPLLISAICLSAQASVDDIFSAVKSGDIEKVKLIIESDTGCINSLDETNKTALFWSVIEDHPDILRYLISRGGDVNGREISGNDPLYYAARYGLTECASILLENGADVNPVEGSASPPLLVACGNEGNGGSVEVVRLLLQYGAAVNGPSDSFLPLRRAAGRGFTGVVNLLLDNGALLPTEEAHLSELLVDSAKGGMVRLYHKLTAAGVKDVAASENGVGLLHHACNSTAGIGEIAGLLIKEGANIDQPDIYGNYPVHYAAERGNINIMRVLVDNGADLNVKTKEGRSPLNIAEEAGYADLADLLSGLGADGRKPHLGLSGDYLGQVYNPDSRIFAPGIVTHNRNAHSVVVFSPDGREAYWQKDGRILFSELSGGEWTIPKYADFSPENIWCDVPFVAPDNSRIFFNSRRPVYEGAGDRKENIWYCEREVNGWSEPRPLPPVVNDMQLHWQISADLEGNIYFGARRNDSRGGSDIYCSKLINGSYQRPENIGDSLNTAGNETCPYVSPSGDYIIFTRIDRNAAPSVCLYISFKGENGTWKRAVSLAPCIPFRSYGLATYVSYDHKYIFYLDGFGNNNTIFWYPAGFIRDIRRD